MDVDDIDDDFTQAEVDHVRGVLRRLLGRGGGVTWGAHDEFELLLTRRRMKADRIASHRMTRATWVLVGVTGALVLATIALVIVTAQLAG